MVEPAPRDQGLLVRFDDERTALMPWRRTAWRRRNGEPLAPHQENSAFAGPRRMEWPYSQKDSG